MTLLLVYVLKLCNLMRQLSSKWCQWQRTCVGKPPYTTLDHQLWCFQGGWSGLYASGVFFNMSWLCHYREKSLAAIKPARWQAWVPERKFGECAGVVVAVCNRSCSRCVQQQLVAWTSECNVLADVASKQREVVRLDSAKKWMYRKRARL